MKVCCLIWKSWLMGFFFFFLFSTLKMLCYCLLASVVSENSSAIVHIVVSLMYYIFLFCFQDCVIIFICGNVSTLMSGGLLIFVVGQYILIGFYKHLRYMTKEFYEFWKVVSQYTLKHFFSSILSLFSPSGNTLHAF